MAVFFKTYASASAETVAPAVAGKIIRLRRVIFTTATNGKLALRQDPGGGSEAPITPDWQGRGGGSPVDIVFASEFPAAGRGLSLGLTTDIADAHGVWIEYEYVD